MTTQEQHVEPPAPRPARQPAGAVDTLGRVLGLLVFLAGIAMIILVFTWVRGVFDGIDHQVSLAHRAYVTNLKTRQQAQDPPDSDQGGARAGQQPIVATPGAGPTVAEVAATIALKMLGLLILGWLGALVAARGAHLTGAYSGKASG